MLYGDGSWGGGWAEGPGAGGLPLRARVNVAVADPRTGGSAKIPVPTDPRGRPAV
eukprot:gene5188-10585_t